MQAELLQQFPHQLHLVFAVKSKAMNPIETFFFLELCALMLTIPCFLYLTFLTISNGKKNVGFGFPVQLGFWSFISTYQLQFGFHLQFPLRDGSTDDRFECSPIPPSYLLNLKQAKQSNFRGLNGKRTANVLPTRRKGSVGWRLAISHSRFYLSDGAIRPMSRWKSGLGINVTRIGWDRNRSLQ